MAPRVFLQAFVTQSRYGTSCEEPSVPVDILGGGETTMDQPKNVNFVGSGITRPKRRIRVALYDGTFKCPNCGRSYNYFNDVIRHQNNDGCERRG